MSQRILNFYLGFNMAMYAAMAMYESSSEAMVEHGLCFSFKSIHYPVAVSREKGMVGEARPDNCGQSNASSYGNDIK